MTEPITTPEPELLPCPFCGCYGISAAYPRILREQMVAIIECHTDSCYAMIVADTLAKAIAAWNRRATHIQPAPEASEDVKALSYGQMVEYEERILAEEMKVVRLERELAALRANQPSDREARLEAVEGCHGLDTPERVCFYEQDFYVLSNFSAFKIRWDGRDFDTSEQAYHWEKFKHLPCQMAIQTARSAHEAFKMAELMKDQRRPDWDDVKIDIMRDILRAKANQHEYVRRKLLATGDRELVENSWRDDFWGEGPNRDGQNMLGKLWMEIRTELRARAALAPAGDGE